MKLLIVAAVLAFAMLPAWAQQSGKLGFVNTERILREAAPA